MNETAFVSKREPDWKRLTFLCDRADATIKNLKPEELHEFVRLYRRVSGDLALVRTKSTNIQLIDFLNDLAGRAYTTLYRSPRKPFFKAIGDAIALSAQTVRRCRHFMYASAILFFGSGALSFLLMQNLSETRDFFVTEEMRPLFENWKEGQFEKRDGSASLEMTAHYATNNPMASILTASLAASTFGIMTANSLYTNGALIGALSYEMNSVGKMGFLWASIFPHGVPEIGGLIIAGGAGFVMGWALINPGRRKRGAALKDAGKDALTLLCTAVVLMFIAAPIEGFFSFNPAVPSIVKIVVIVIELVFWGFFWSGFAKDKESLPGAASLASEVRPAA